MLLGLNVRSMVRLLVAGIFTDGATVGRHILCYIMRNYFKSIFILTYFLLKLPKYFYWDNIFFVYSKIKNQKDEEIRYDDVYMIHSGKWIFIRFNPDDNISKVDIDDKLDTLIDKMHECINRIENDENIELVEIYKLYC
jgi:uncharacterized membrane protein YobD (UPF0266 family)